MELSERSKKYAFSGIRAVFEAAAKYENTINFGIGEPGFRTGQNVIDKTAWALNNGYTKYVSNAGIPALREAIAERSRTLNGLDCDASNVHVFVGATHALLMTMLCVLNPGEDILIPCPYYAAYIGMADVAALSGDQRYVDAITKIWDNVVGKKYHLTGGCGARSIRKPRQVQPLMGHTDGIGFQH